MGKVAKGVGCSVAGCSSKAEVSISADKVGRYLNVGREAKRAYLCKAHYKEYKRLSKKERELERARYGV